MDLFLGRVSGGDELRVPTARLTTHGVVVGMTGSGKTGLCLVMLEELAAAGVPVIAVDPKGDLGSLALVFPELRTEDFAPWVEATPGHAPDPAGTAARWREGLSKWGLGAEHMRVVRERAPVRVYTPGSEAATPVNIAAAFQRPAGGAADADGRRQLVTDTVSGLLGLVGRTADPVRDPAHIVLSTILDRAWEAGEDPTIETLVLRLVDPPFPKVGVFPLDQFFKADDRMKLAMELNGVLASPSFAAWAKGAPLDVGTLFSAPGVHVFHLAHLSDAERQFFLSLLFARVVAWSRSQPGSADLRALLFVDEVAGMCPPHPHDPPTKAPLLALMKQARAVGLGVVLATQNPVDVDYKALSNAGLWFVGRLQTAQDRERVLPGAGVEVHRTVEALTRGQFLLHDAAGSDRVIEVRHAMCYLRGPMTRADLGRLATAPSPVSAAVSTTVVVPSATVAASSSSVSDERLLAAPPPCPVPQWFLDARVVFSSRLAETFAPYAEPPRADGKTAHRPALYAELLLRFDEERYQFVLDHRERRIWFPLGDGLPSEPIKLDGEATDMLPSAPDGACFAALPTWMDEKKELDQLSRQVVESVFRTETRGLFLNAPLKLYGRAEESREDFDARCKAAVSDLVDAEAAKLKDRYDREAERLDERIRFAQTKITDLEGQAKTRQLEEVVNAGELLLGFFTGRRKSVSAAVSKRRMTMGAGERLGRAQEETRELEEKAYELENKLNDEVAKIRSRHEAALDRTEERAVRLEKSDIQVAAFGVLWVPVTRRV